MKKIFFILMLLALSAAACQTAAEPTVSAENVQNTAEARAMTMVAETAAAAPTATPVPPTATSTPTETPVPATETPLPATVTPTAAPSVTPTADFLSTHSRTLPEGKIGHIRIINHTGEPVHILLYNSVWFNEFTISDELTVETPVDSIVFYGYYSNGRFFSNIAYVTDDIHTWVIHINPDAALVEGP